MMPGFAFNLSKFHCFLRPHISKNQVGFALILSTFINVADLNKPTLEYLFANFNGQLLPMFTFVVRSFNTNSKYGDIRCSMFIIFSTNGYIFVEFDNIFLFNPITLPKGYLNNTMKTVNDVHENQMSNNDTGFISNESEKKDKHDQHGNESKIAAQLERMNTGLELSNKLKLLGIAAAGLGVSALLFKNRNKLIKSSL